MALPSAFRATPQYRNTSFHLASDVSWTSGIPAGSVLSDSVPGIHLNAMTLGHSAGVTSFFQLSTMNRKKDVLDNVHVTIYDFDYDMFDLIQNEIYTTGRQLGCSDHTSVLNPWSCSILQFGSIFCYSPIFRCTLFSCGA